MKTAALRLDTLSDDALLARVVELVGRSRRVEAELVWHLAEVDARRLYLREACPSMHVHAVPDPIRRAVWRRDGGQCTFRDRKGRRCPAREQLEFHHVVPFAQGGDHRESNVRLACRAHNQVQADLDYGAGFMAARRLRSPGTTAGAAR